jgi:hypothetical protein
LFWGDAGRDNVGGSVAGVELSAEARAIESLIDTGQKEVAGTRLQAACAYFGRRPEYRYLVCLYDSRFRVRSDGELLGEVSELVGEQPELIEATALLAELYARAGNGARAGLFARMALESKSPAARARATVVLTSPAGEAKSGAGAPRQTETERKPTAVESSLSAWFERARRELVHRRSPAYGVRAFQSVVEMLLDWGQTVSEGSSFLSPEPMPLTRESLAVVDQEILTLRRQLGRHASQSDASRTMAAAGFFLAVVLHELEASVLEISPDDGGCKVLLPSGAGARPLFVATAYVDGSGPSLVQTFDRLAAAHELASGPPSSGRMRRGVSSGRMPTTSPSSKPSVRAKPARDELALNRAQAESQRVRALDRPTWPADPPPFDLPHIAAALARSPLGEEIAARSGAFLSPTPASVEALESYCTATRGEGGAAPDVGRWQPSDEEEELILAWGAVLGETLISAYGGLWECDPGAPSDLRLFRVICQDRVAAWPMTEVYLRLRDGSRHSLIDFLAKVGSLLA